MFGLLDAVYFRPLPIADPAALVDVTLDWPGNRFGTLSYEEFRDIERTSTTFADVMAIGQRGVTWNRNGETRIPAHPLRVGTYFPSLGIAMHLGRGFTQTDDDPGANDPQVVINHYLWRERLGAPPDIIGRDDSVEQHAFHRDWRHGPRICRPRADRAHRRVGHDGAGPARRPRLARRTRGSPPPVVQRHWTVERRSRYPSGQRRT